MTLSPILGVSGFSFCRVDGFRFLFRVIRVSVSGGVLQDFKTEGFWLGLQLDSRVYSFR